MQLVRKLVEFHPYGPALKGSGDERAKATKLLNEIQDRWFGVGRAGGGVEHAGVGGVKRGRWSETCVRNEEIWHLM